MTCRPYLGNNDIETQAQYTVTDHIVGDVLSLHLPIEDLELVERPVKGELDTPVRGVHGVKSARNVVVVETLMEVMMTYLMFMEAPSSHSVMPSIRSWHTLSRAW